MEDAPCLLVPGVEPFGWESAIAQLSQRLAEVEVRCEQLQRENYELRQQAGYWKSRHGDAVTRIAELEQNQALLQGENRKLQADLFGRKSEKQGHSDRSNQLADPADPKLPRRRGQQPNHPGPKRRNYEHLPVREEFCEIPIGEQVCPDCNCPFSACGTEDSEQIEIETVIYRRVIRRRRYQRTCECRGPQTRTASPPPKLIPKSRFGVSIWVEVLLDKFASHRPTERLRKHWRDLGLDVSPGTIATGLQQLEPLFQGISEAIQQRNKMSSYRQADETRWKVFVVYPGKVGHGWWVWVFLGEDTVVFVLAPSRDHEVPEAYFPENASGPMMVDRYAAYKAMLQVKNGTLVLAFCWAHVRRDFVRVGKGWPELKPWALEWLRRIRDLYRANRRRLEAPTEGVPAVELLQRQIAAMKQQAEAELADPHLRKPQGKVLESLQAHWEGLTLFLGDPRIPMDNNASERSGRNPALGRKNYYGSGAIWSGQLAMKMFSILATLEKWDINPRLWLTWFLESCAMNGSKPPSDPSIFMPWNLSTEKLAQLTGKTHPEFYETG
jgi:transposase